MPIRKASILTLGLIVLAGCTTETPSEEPPEMNRFTVVTLGGGTGLLDEPMAFDVTDDGEVYIAERKGGLKVYNPLTDAITDVGLLETNITYTNYQGGTRNAEEGLVGFILDPDFDENNWVYMLYADPHTAKHNLSRFTIVNDTLDHQSEELLLDFPVQRNYCCHTGGGMDWDANGNLLVTIGNNTQNSSGSQTDQRQGREYRDDQRGAANTHDLRGKIIRIHPEDDGTYTVPEGNLFPKGMDGTRPEIYAMGLRNPWRISVDSETGWIYWSEVGPDNGRDLDVGPRGYDEFNQAKSPGFFGWPYFIGPNRAFPMYDYINDTIGEPQDPASPMNRSRNNTGIINLPPAQPAFIYYEDAPSEDFPLVETGGRSASGNRVYHVADYPNADDPYPSYYEDKFFITDFSREWLMVVTMDENGNYESMERFLPDYHPVEPIDMDFGPDGNLYVLEYGGNWFNYSPQTRLARIEYTSGNRAPEVLASANVRGGNVPLDVQLSSGETIDYDGDDLSYQWEVTDEDGSVVQSFTTADATLSLSEPGVYTATLTATDPAGATGAGSVEIIAGNTPPQVSLDVNSTNQSFFFPGETIQYSTSVNDAEDGSLGSGISSGDVSISINYASSNFDFSLLEKEERNIVVDRHLLARTMIENSGCFSCHQINSASAGPAYMQVAERYSNGPDTTLTYLSNKIISGGSGVWGEIRMPAHPSMSPSDARLVAEYLLSLDGEDMSPLPSRGSYTLSLPEEDNGLGRFVFRAAYQDEGADGLPPIASQSVTTLRSPRFNVSQADIIENVTLDDDEIEPISGSYIALEGIDMTGVRQIAAFTSVDDDQLAGSIIEVRLGSADGQLIGRGEAMHPPEQEGGGGGGFGFGGPPDPPTLMPITTQVSGTQDVYFVFRNDQAGADETLMEFSNFVFMNHTGPVEED